MRSVVLAALWQSAEGACADGSESCGTWRDAGYCTDATYIDYMQSNCKVSCGLCPAPTPSPSPSGGCLDTSTDCSGWQNMGYCASSSEYSAFMADTCPATCGLCPGPTPTPPSPSPSPQSGCVALSENAPASGTINVILVPSAFFGDMALWDEKAALVYSKFSEHNPVNANQISQLNFYYVRADAPGDNGRYCNYNCQGIQRLLCCDGYEWQKHALNYCTQGQKMQILVVHNNDEYGGAGGANWGTTSTNAMASFIAIHEIGHSLFGLGDEYINSPSDINAPTSLNCDYAGCSKWSDMIGTFAGADCASNHCGTGNWYAPGANTIMNSLGGGNTFGPVNDRITCCKYLLETDSIPGYCNPYNSNGFNLQSFCQQQVWKGSLHAQNNQSDARQKQGKEFVHVREPTEWELMRNPVGEWECVRLGDLEPGFYPLDNVDGDTKAPLTGGQIAVQVQGLSSVRWLYFNEFETIRVPIANDGAALHVPLARMELNMILQQGEICSVAKSVLV